jgi:hypothetical protein
VPDGRVEFQTLESYILVFDLSLLPVCFSLLFSHPISIGTAQKLRSDYICRYRTGLVKLSGCTSWYVCIIDMHADVGEHYTSFQDETDFRNITFVNLFEERVGIEKGVMNGIRYTSERPTSCTPFLINLFQ